MKKLLAVFLVSLSATASAQYKCTVNGKTTYSDAPCAGSQGAYVGKMQDSVSERARMDAELLRRKDAMQRNAIERREAAQFRRDQELLGQMHADDQASKSAAARQQQRNCANLKRDMTWNKEDIARYQDFGWQRQLTQREIQLKQNREAYESAGCK